MPATLQQRWQRRAFACEADAHQAAILCRRELSLHSHHLTYTVATEWVPAKRAARGRPPTGPRLPSARCGASRWQVQEATEAITTQAQREGQEAESIPLGNLTPIAVKIDRRDLPNRVCRDEGCPVITSR